jgi:hypothetical protein
MRLNSITFAEFEGTPQEWHLEGLTLGPRNLIVGKNATGKTRALNVISGLAKHLAGLLPPGISARYDCSFSRNSDAYRYEVHIEEEQVLSERYTRNGDVLLDRGKDGEGTIYAEEIDGGKRLRFQAPTSQFAALARRDNIQHKFLEPLFEWASSLRHVYFGTSLGKEKFAIFVEGGSAGKVDEHDTGAVVALFRRAQRDFKDPFVNAVMKDMAAVDYVVSEIGVQPPLSVRFQGSPGTPVALYAKETDLPGITDQHSMSQGMFRVLSLLIHINYFAFKKSAATVLIDDIGEGLDFDRSCRLIDLLRQKAASTNTQIVFTTNDRFVMNRVPLEEWSVLQRRHNHVTVRNYANSREAFEEFKFTGLSNFSLLEMDVLGQESPRGTKK